MSLLIIHITKKILMNLRLAGEVQHGDKSPAALPLNLQIKVSKKK